MNLLLVVLVSIDVLVTLSCDENYSGRQCQCNEDRAGCQDGFYTCSDEGEKVCVDGWSGTECKTHDGSTCAAGGEISLIPSFS